ncbi:hypothetical protein Taro_013766 [Colocasia esculenta]|uniref:Uncharacterized protein n=1 Tax=Colocasia esculenta TaxID=4460 RepID=A0A843UH30_COLES|nr:hypothetical protein [Colocasia esculenta]
MKKNRGFRLGRRLVRLWRWVRRPRAKRAAYLRLATTPSSSSPRHSRHDTEITEVPAMLAHWARCFTRRLCHAPRAYFGGDEGCDSRLLGDEHGLSDQGKQQRQQGVARAKPPPKGHLVVYVGRKGVDPLYRVPVPVVYFNHPLFGELLRQAEREFGFHQPGGITIPCPLSDFESVRTRVAADAGVSCRHRGQPAGL